MPTLFVRANSVEYNREDVVQRGLISDQLHRFMELLRQRHVAVDFQRLLLLVHDPFRLLSEERQYLVVELFMVGEVADINQELENHEIVAVELPDHLDVDGILRKDLRHGDQYITSRDACQTGDGVEYLNTLLSRPRERQEINGL